MTEQERFHFDYVCGDTGLIDEQAELKWFIENCCSIKDLKENWKIVCDKLNEINEENEELKERVKQLQIDNTVIKKIYESLIDENKELKKENQQLQNQIEMLKTTIARNEAYIHQMQHKGEWRK